MGTYEYISAGYILFDSVKGTLLILAYTGCGGAGCDNYVGGSWIVRINGFTPLATALRRLTVSVK